MNVETVGLIAFVFTLVNTTLGLPAQIKENYKRQSVHGLSLFMNINMLFVFLSWIFYGNLKNDWYILASNAPGAICVIIILGQFYVYRGRKAI